MHILLLLKIPKVNRLELGCNLQGIPVLKFTYSPIDFIWAAFVKYPEQRAFLTTS